MFDRTDLAAAVQAGVIDAKAAGRLESFFASRRGADSAGDPESLRFLANFNDIFISIGLVLLVAGVLAFAGMMNIGDDIPSAATALATLAPAAIASWALAEYFCARRRLLLPSIVLCAMFCLFCGLAGAAIFGEQAAQDVESFTRAFNAAGNLGLVGAGSVAAAALVFFVRFRLPFALFVLALALAAMAYTGVAFFGDTGLVMGGALSLLIGIATLVIGIWLDMGDPQRIARRSDHAFWLHLAAAPQIILGVRGMTLGFFGEHDGPGTASILLFILIFFAIASLALNRRALIVSSLLTYGLALGALIEGMGMNMVNTTIFTLILLGSAVVLIGGGWSTARRGVLSVVPSGGIWERIFPPEPAHPAKLA